MEAAGGVDWLDESLELLLQAAKTNASDIAASAKTILRVFFIKLLHVK